MLWGDTMTVRPAPQVIGRHRPMQIALQSGLGPDKIQEVRVMVRYQIQPNLLELTTTHQ